MTDPLVSICCITYNHASFIKECLEGFIMQNTNFKFEVLIHDDASTDGTERIIKEYEAKYPEIIKPLFEKDNQWVKGRRGSVTFNFPRAKGKYIAMCEGDDYWTDPYKLQNQVDFLEKNPEYFLCSHAYSIVDYNNNFVGRPTKDLEENFPIGFDITINNFFERWYTKTLTTIFRKDAVNLPITSYSFVNDTVLYFHILLTGKGYWMNLHAGCYRIHKEGIWSSLKLKQNLITTFKIYTELYKQHKNVFSLRNALVDKNLQIIQYLMHNNNRAELSLKELFKYCFNFYTISSDKRRARQYLDEEVVEPLVLRLKIKLRKTFNLFYSIK